MSLLPLDAIRLNEKRQVFGENAVASAQTHRLKLALSNVTIHGEHVHLKDVSYLFRGE